MTVEGLQNYLGARLPLELNARQQLRLLRTVFALVFAGAAIIHIVQQSNIDWLGTLVHATTISLIYVIGVGAATTLLFMLRDTAEGPRVWHIWVISVAGFVLGFYFLPFDDLLVRLTGKDIAGHGQPISFAQLIPVWFVVTYLFVQPYLAAGLKAELDRLREVNSMLERRVVGQDPAPQQTIQFESGRTAFSLEASSIRNVSVIDHYCYVHYRENNGFAKRDLALPLRDVAALLPQGFVRVHRSHIVNVSHVSSVRRDGRNIRLVLDSSFEVPVSRHRLETVLPKLRDLTRVQNSQKLR